MSEPTKQQIRMARDSGEARRSRSYDRTNPYPAGPLADAFDAAWVELDKRLGCDGNGKDQPNV